MFNSTFVFRASHYHRGHVRPVPIIYSTRRRSELRFSSPRDPYDYVVVSNDNFAPFILYTYCLQVKDLEGQGGRFFFPWPYQHSLIFKNSILLQSTQIIRCVNYGDEILDFLFCALSSRRIASNIVHYGIGRAPSRHGEISGLRELAFSRL
jgi:hypothetical protein